MLFNSYEFIFLFLPISVAIFYLLSRSSLASARLWITLASLFFYAWWRPFNVLLIGPSIIVNFTIVRLLLGWGERRPAASTFAFWCGIAFNLCFLGYFKYLDFFATISNDIAGTHFVLQYIVLPLGISFVTFQKIALLIDVRAGRVEQVKLKDYALFVLFFPPLISGPIVHYRELMPQFDALDGRWRWENLAVGGSLFFAGLFKKLLIADPIAALVSPIWLDAFHGAHPALLQAWAAALGFTVQLYFDFSGYSDMAIGAARLFGVKLPYNFNSPLKSSSITDFWVRWHSTLTRFLTAYLFSPMSLLLTRRRMAQGAPIMAGRRTGVGAFATLVAMPTLITMFLSGIWHGAGYQFIIFGMMHGVALVINHAWRLWKPKSWPDSGRAGASSRLAGWALTMLLAVTANVFFRSNNIATALRVLHGMVLGEGVAVPPPLFRIFVPLFHPLGVTVQPSWEGGSVFLQLWALVLLGWFVALVLPNTHEVLARFDPALGFRIKADRVEQLGWRIWRPTARWAWALSAVTLLGVMSLGHVSEFLYWKF